ncbi:MAG TPA: hypothetical protein VN442_19675 [Bryobacteraceae bacterium]|nr:hypothetical protein [Bryobacteraceae bacterium]
MVPQYKSILPATIRALVDEIETAAGTEIAVRHRPQLTLPMRVHVLDGSCVEPGHGGNSH